MNAAGLRARSVVPADVRPLSSDGKVPEKRLPDEIKAISRATPILDTLEHPAWGLNAPDIWQATCRIITPRGTGSGFFTVSAAHNRTVVITNAHVIHGYQEAKIEFVAPGIIITVPACLLAVDYIHDLAILEPHPQALASEPVDYPSLEMGESPTIGEDIMVCGFPFGCETPRLGTGIVSGYDSVEHYGVDIATVVIDAAINAGNSGGPVCNKTGEVVGVVHAGPVPLLPIPEQNASTLDPSTRQTLDLVKRLLRANTGIGYALDPADVRQLLQIFAVWFRRTADVYRQYEPQVLEMETEDFCALQRHAVSAENPPDDSSPIGVFSYAEDGSIYLGWAQDPDRVELRGLDAWCDLAISLGRDGGSFMLQGYEVLLYRVKYHGYIVPVRIQLTDG
jgi:hypothetical protein